MEQPKEIKKMLALFLLIIIVLVGSYLRIKNLDNHSFWIDEFRHVFAAKGIIDTGKPILPSGITYYRAINYTYLVSLSFRLFGVSEASARLPSLILGILMIFLAYYVTSKMLGRNVGLISAFLVAFSPFCILWSTECRMYSLLQPLYLLSAFYFFCIFEKNHFSNEKGYFSLYNIKKLISFLLIYIFTLSIHDLGILFIPTVIIYFLLMFPFVFLKQGKKAALHSKYLKGLIMLFIFGLVINILFVNFQNENLLIKIMHYLTKTPIWSIKNSHNINFYRSFLFSNYPIFTSFYMIILFTLILTKPKIGFFLGSSFLTPFIALSVLGTWKAPRFIYFIFPFFLITIAFGIEYVLYYGWRTLKQLLLSFLSVKDLKKNKKTIFFVTFFCFLFLLYPILFPWIKKPLKEFAEFKYYDVKELSYFVNKIGKKDLIICTEPFAIEYYSLRRPDFIINTNEFLSENTNLASPEVTTSKQIDDDDMGGIPIIKSLQELKEIERTNNKIWIISYRYYINTPMVIDEYIINYIKRTYKQQLISDGIYEIYYK